VTTSGSWEVEIVTFTVPPLFARAIRAESDNFTISVSPKEQQCDPNVYVPVLMHPQ